MKLSMGIAARKREREQHNQAAQEQGSLHGMSKNSDWFEGSMIPA